MLRLTKSLRSTSVNRSRRRPRGEPCRQSTQREFRLAVLDVTPVGAREGFGQWPPFDLRRVLYDFGGGDLRGLIAIDLRAHDVKLFADESRGQIHTDAESLERRRG